jgi:hypothetical protein
MALEVLVKRWGVRVLTYYPISSKGEESCDVLMNTPFVCLRLSQQATDEDSLPSLILYIFMKEWAKKIW